MNDDLAGVPKKDRLEVFAKTGHDALNALLLVSAGSVVTFVTLLGAILGGTSGKPSLDDESIGSFIVAVKLLGCGVIFCLGAYLASFGSHAYYYLAEDQPIDKKKKKAAARLTILAVIFALISIGFLALGGLESLRGLAATGVRAP